jgi:hypothetical protein
LQCKDALARSRTAHDQGGAVSWQPHVAELVQSRYAPIGALGDPLRATFSFAITAVPFGGEAAPGTVGYLCGSPHSGAGGGRELWDLGTCPMMAALEARQRERALYAGVHRLRERV